MVGEAIEDGVRRLEPGGRIQRVQRLTGGVSADVFRLDIATGCGSVRRVVFRRHRAAHSKAHSPRVCAKEFHLLAALHRQGLQVPEPYVLGHGPAAPTPYLIMEWIDGSTEVGVDELPAALQEMARFLAAVHSVDPATAAAAELEPIEDPATAIAAYLPPTDVGRRLRAMLDGGRVDGDPHRPVLLHGDYWPGNVIWRGSDLAAVIDWEDACLGSPLADLAGARVELLCQYGSGAMEQFTSHYLSEVEASGTALRLEYLPLWEAYVSAAALSTMHTWRLEPADEARRRQSTEQFFNRAAGYIDW